MLDLNFMRENLDLVAQKLAERGMAGAGLEHFRELDTERRRVLVEVEKLKNRRNVAGEEIARLKRDRQDASALIAEMKAVSDRIKEIGRASCRERV